jgi:hypothetical protein
MHTVFCRTLHGIDRYFRQADGIERSAQHVKLHYTELILEGLDHTDLRPMAALVENWSKRSSTPNQLILQFQLSPLPLHIIVYTFRPRYTPCDTEAGTESRGSRRFDSWFLGEIIKHLD